MPNLRSAKKKARKDVKRTRKNAIHRTAIEKAVKLFQKMKETGLNSDKIKKTISLIDKAAKKKIIHKNKAARLKSRIMKLPNKKK